MCHPKVWIKTDKVSVTRMNVDIQYRERLLPMFGSQIEEALQERFQIPV